MLAHTDLFIIFSTKSTWLAVRSFAAADKFFCYTLSPTNRVESLVSYLIYSILHFQVFQRLIIEIEFVQYQYRFLMKSPYY